MVRQLGAVPPISIHALREEGDAPRVLNYRPKANFYPRPPRGGRLVKILTNLDLSQFLSTPSARRATQSAHAPADAEKFLSTPSARRATRRPSYDRLPGAISIHALREEGDQGTEEGHRPLSISIHALREEGDTAPSWTRGPSANFYPRPPRGGRRLVWSTSKNDRVFLSTPSARRATWPPRLPRNIQSDFYPRPPRGGRRS